jgi:hypothetical protein
MCVLDWDGPRQTNPLQKEHDTSLDFELHAIRAEATSDMSQIEGFYQINTSSPQCDFSRHGLSQSAGLW